MREEPVIKILGIDARVRSGSRKEVSQASKLVQRRTHAAAHTYISQCVKTHFVMRNFQPIMWRALSEPWRHLRHFCRQISKSTIHTYWWRWRRGGKAAKVQSALCPLRGVVKAALDARHHPTEPTSDAVSVGVDLVLKTNRERQTEAIQ